MIDIAEKIGYRKLTVIRKSFNDIKYHMLELVELARSWLGGDKKDKTLDAALLRNLVEANSEEVGSKRLNDGQLLSNAFVFLVAGHETTAHSLSFMIAFMAVYPEVQRKVREEVLSLTDGDPSTPLNYKEHLSKLVYTLAVFYETGRLCTVAPRLGRRVLADTTLTGRLFEVAPDNSAQNIREFQVPLKRGSQVILDMTAVHRNPIHWGKDVNEFRPERFIDTDSYRWPRDYFLAFSTGHRSCIGQKFSTTESLCLVANLVRQFDILPPPDLRDKPFEEQKSITDWKTWLTTTPSDARVSLRPRF
ncbi:cytochrome P450 [Marasmius fiardii PR-910]|nr:cytochrome P450 [Marasmius fiardii PR-910]